VEIRQHEFAGLDVSGEPPRARAAKTSPVMARGARVEKLAGGFFNISGGAAAPNGDFYFVDAHWQRIYLWRPSARQLSTVCDYPLEPVNLAVDQAGDLMDGVVYNVTPRGEILPLKPQPVSDAAGKCLHLPTSDWHLNQDSLSHPAAHFISPDGTTVLPAGQDFLDGATSWGVKSSPPIRSFGLGRASLDRPFYVTDESMLRTWAADVNADGSLRNFRLFAETGGESVTSDSRGNVYIAAGQIYVYDLSGKMIDTIEVPERPVQLVFGGVDHQTLFVCSRTTLYSIRMLYPGW
jgi:hypothetical protein